MPFHERVRQGVEKSRAVFSHSELLTHQNQRLSTRKFLDLKPNPFGPRVAIYSDRKTRPFPQIDRHV